MHRLIWLLKTGRWPLEVIDHIDGVTTNNKWVNLRDVSRAENQKNMKMFCNNTSGHRGVCWDKARNTWNARIKVRGITISLGRFTNFEEAKVARLAAEVYHKFHPNHGRRI